VSRPSYGLMALLLAAVLAWQLVSGKPLSAWWSGLITRQDRPRAYWFSVAAQGAILIAFLLTGKTWQVR
jgi:hypothetical protein